MQVYRLSGVVGTLAVLLLGGCAGGDGDALPLTPTDVERLTAPAARTNAYISRINKYRNQAFSAVPGTTSNVAHSDAVYTAAYRHAVWLNTSNSASWTPDTPYGEEGEVTMPDSEYVKLNDEATVKSTTAGTGSFFPAMATGKTPITRLGRVVGGKSLLNGLLPRDVMEFYAFNGDVQMVEGDTVTSAFRGFDTSTGLNEVDSLWYSVTGRLGLMRPDTKYVGLANPYDGGVEPPYPVMQGRLSGVALTVGSGTQVARLSYWPSDGNLDVVPYGLDTGFDIGGKGLDVNTEDLQASQYSGPPIHVTLPTGDPILFNKDIGQPSLVVKFKKMEKDPVTDLPQQQPAPFQKRTFWVLTYSTTDMTFYYVALENNEVDGYQYTPINDGKIKYNAPYQLRGNELFIVPSEPLEPNSWYEVGVRLQSASAVLEDTSDPTHNQFHLFKWKFKTNDKAAPPYRF